MIGCSKKNRENYPGKCFGTKEKETGLGFNRGLALIGFPTTGPWGRRRIIGRKKELASEASPAGRGMGGEGSAAPVPPQPQVPSIPCSVPLARAVVNFFSPSGSLVPG